MVRDNDPQVFVALSVVYREVVDSNGAPLNQAGR